MFNKIAAAALSIFLYFGSIGGALASENVTLRMHSFSGTQAPEYKYFVQPFMKRLADRSKGKLKLDYFPNMQLGGNAFDLVQQLEDGAVDLILTQPGFARGRFAGLEALQLPFLNAGTAKGQTRALYQFADRWLMNADFKGLKLIHMHATDASVFHTSSALLDSMEAFDGMKIRAPGRYIGEAINVLGGDPVVLGFSEVYEAMERGQIDGFANNWAIVPSFKLQEVTSLHLDFPVYQDTILVLMRQASFDALSQELKDVIEDCISIESSIAVAQNIDDLTEAAKVEIQAEGNTIYSLSDEEQARWRKAVRPVYMSWIGEMTAKGLPALMMFESLLEITAFNGRT